MLPTDSTARFSRRTLFKALGLGGAAALMPSRSRAVALPATDGHLATFLDLSKCIGCGECVQACRQANAARFPNPRNPFPAMYPPRVKAEDFSDKRDVDDRLTPYNWLFVQHAEADGREVFIPRRCMHCVNPPCANLCPWGAAAREADGAVAIDAGICLGGAKCRDVCPWEIPQRQTGVGLYLDLAPNLAGNGVMYKCDRCRDRRAQGKLPACIEACPQGVQSIGPRGEIVAMARELAARTGGHLYGLEENGGTNTIYLSPVPFERLNASLTAQARGGSSPGGGNGQSRPAGRTAGATGHGTDVQRDRNPGPGRPHLAAVGSVMETSNTLAWAVLLAPLAGAASALLKGTRSLLGHGHGDGQAAAGTSAARAEVQVRDRTGQADAAPSGPTARQVADKGGLDHE